MGAPGAPIHFKKLNETTRIFSDGAIWRVARPTFARI
jgi:hypothetical protein